MRFRSADTIACCVLLLALLAAGYAMRWPADTVTPEQVAAVERYYMTKIDSLEAVIAELPEADSAKDAAPAVPKDTKKAAGGKASGGTVFEQSPAGLDDHVGGSR